MAPVCDVICVRAGLLHVMHGLLLYGICHGASMMSWRDSGHRLWSQAESSTCRGAGCRATTPQCSTKVSSKASTLMCERLSCIASQPPPCCYRAQSGAAPGIGTRAKLVVRSLASTRYPGLRFAAKSSPAPVAAAHACASETSHTSSSSAQGGC